MVKNESGHYFLLGKLLLVFCIGSTVSALNTKDPFYPCESSTDIDKIFRVFCNRISAKRVKTAFDKSKIYHIDKFVLNLSIKDLKIPANVVGNHSIGNIALRCPGQNHLLRVDSAAFAFTKSVTDTLNISNCNLNFLNWSFLKGFSNLSSLNIFANSSNLHKRFHTLPAKTLINLRIFHLDSVLGLNGFNQTCIKFPTPPPNGLSELWIDDCFDLGSSALQILLQKWVTPTSTETLTSLHLNANSLTRIPSEISKYNALLDVDISGNRRSLTIEPKSFIISTGYDPYSMVSLSLRNSKITSISPGAIVVFNGLGITEIHLNENKLTTFDENVFGSVFESSYRGYIYADGNPFDCSTQNQCKMAWLFKKILVSDIIATCSNGTEFSDLNPNDLRWPDGTLCS